MLLVKKEHRINAGQALRHKLFSPKKDFLLNKDSEFSLKENMEKI